MFNKKRITHGISFPNPDLLDVAKHKAATMNISFSGYINQLIRRDLGMGGVFDWERENRETGGSDPLQTGQFREVTPADQKDRLAK